MKRSSLLLLIICNLAWTLNPMTGKILLGTFTGVQVAWIRYFSAFLAFLFYAVFSIVFRKQKWGDFFLIPAQLRPRLEVVLLGLGPFVFSPIMQFVGLETAQAMDNSILIATEPLITVILAWAILGEKMNRSHFVSMGLALTGFLFFSGFLREDFGVALSLGMVFLILAQFGEGIYSVFSRKLVVSYRPMAILGTALAIGAFVLSGFVGSFDRFPDLGQASPSQFAAILWLGPIGSTLTYLIWAMVARTVTVPAMAITLFIQPLCGALLGYFFLGEGLTPGRAFGAFLILVAVTFLSWKEICHSRDFAPK